MRAAYGMAKSGLAVASMAKSGLAVASMSVMRPELVMKSIVAVVMAGLLVMIHKRRWLWPELLKQKQWLLIDTLRQLEIQDLLSRNFQRVSQFSRHVGDLSIHARKHCIHSHRSCFPFCFSRCC